MSFVHTEVVVDVRAHINLAFPGGFLTGAVAMDASGFLEGLATRGTSIDDIVARALLFFSCSQAVNTKFHGTTPA
jgi:hypothetical protein